MMSMYGKKNTSSLWVMSSVVLLLVTDQNMIVPGKGNKERKMITTYQRLEMICIQPDLHYWETPESQGKSSFLSAVMLSSTETVTSLFCWVVAMKQQSLTVGFVPLAQL